MIEKIIEYSARNRFMIILAVAFAVLAGVWSIQRIPLDAIPDLSDVQVIVFTRWMGRSPDLVEDQVTYPIVSALLSAPKVKVVRGFSDFGHSFVYVIFEDGTDIYWARSRVLEYMNTLAGKLPEGANPTLGPDATGVGWVFQYALVDTIGDPDHVGSGQHSLADLRSFQDWYLRYWISAVPGVAEVATVGGFVRQYQVNVDPNKLLAYNLPLTELIHRIRMSNNDIGGRVVEFSGAEYMVRGRGYIQSIADIEQIAVGTDGNGTPILLRDVATVTLGPDLRRGIADLDGKGDVVGGIVVMRYGENALNVIQKVKDKLKEVEPGLPKGVKIVTTYDRSDLIHQSINTLKHTLMEELIVVSAVIIIFLLHFRTALIPIISLPIAVIISFIPMYFMGITSNIMSLGGIAIAIGAMVDASIVLTENAHKRLEKWEQEGRKGDRFQVMLNAAKEVGKPIFYSLLVIAVGFMPVFTLEAQEGRLFKPLAFTKNFAMFFAAVLAITLTPALMTIFIRGKIISEERHPISRFLIWLYTPVVKWVLKYRTVTVLVAMVLVLLTVPAFLKLGSEFMPPLYEGTILYMPTTLPGISVTEAERLLQVQDKILKSFPEVERVFGKAGRAETSTDPAPFSMMETTVVLKPKNYWRKGLTYEKLVEEMDRVMQFPGVSNAWTMPIKARIDMLTTGVRTPVGIKIFGPDLNRIEKLGEHLEMVLQNVPGTRSVFAERVTGGYYLDFRIRREDIARYGLTVEDVEMIIESAIGGENITTTIEGRERYPINVRYARELRDDLEKLRRVLIPTPSGAQVPLEQLADIYLTSGPPMLRDEDGMLSGYVYVDMTGRDIGSYVRDAKRVVAEQVKLPPGYYLTWSGQYEYMQRVKARLNIFVPLTILIIFVLLYLNFKSVTETFIVMFSVPFSLVGGIWLMYLLGYNLSIAVWVGIIALAGVAAETGVVMIVYIDEAWERRLREGKRTLSDLYEAIIEGAVQRVRPKIMTVGTTIIGLLPVMWSTGAGADVMKRIAAPMVGGLVSSTVLTLVIIPAVYALWKRFSLEKKLA